MKVKIFLILILALGFFLRIYKLDSHGVFTDEKFTLLNANGYWVGAYNQKQITEVKYFTPAHFWESKSINDYFESIAHSDFGTHIVYNFFQKAWMSCFGNSDFSIRFPSILFNLCTIFVLYLLVFKVFGKQKYALTAAFLLAIEPLNIAQSHIARSYTLSFLLVILATYVFILILQAKRPNKLYFILYTFLIGLSLLNHYLNFLVPLAHALVFVVFNKNKKLWWGFILAGFFNLSLMAWWFTVGGGYLAFDFLKDKNQKHLAIANNPANPMSSAIQPSRPDIVAKKTIELFFDLSPVSHANYEHLNGVKIFLASFVVFVFILLFFHFFKKKKLVFSFVIFVLVGFLIWNFKEGMIGIFISNVLYFCILFVFLDEFKRGHSGNNGSKWLLAICGLMYVLPILFVLNDAFKNGHTTSLIHRYIGVASPFVCILFGVGLPLFFNKGKLAQLVLVIFVPLQLSFLSNQITQIYEDQSGKYAWYTPPRISNPYFKVATLIKNEYQPGDTLLIPSYTESVYTPLLGKSQQKSFLDAQYLNLYLDKSLKIIERVDETEKDKVYLISKRGKKRLMFDFCGLKYRY